MQVLYNCERDSAVKSEKIPNFIDVCHRFQNFPLYRASFKKFAVPACVFAAYVLTDSVTTSKCLRKPTNPHTCEWGFQFRRSDAIVAMLSS